MGEAGRADNILGEQKLSKGLSPQAKPIFVSMFSLVRTILKTVFLSSQELQSELGAEKCRIASDNTNHNTLHYKNPYTDGRNVGQCREITSKNKTSKLWFPPEKFLWKNLP